MENIKNNDNELKQKIDGVYKEILSNSLSIIGCDNPRKLNKEDIKIFYQALNRLYDLKEEYNQKFYNRKELGNKISNLASLLMIFANRIQSQIDNDRSNYKNSDELFIINFKKMMHILFNAQNSTDFSLKKIYASGKASFEIKDGARETEPINGIVYIIGDTNILNQMEDEKLYWENDIKKFTNKLLECEKSLIIASDYYFANHLLPNDNTLSRLEIKGNSSIYCYLKDDIMNEIVNNFLSYAEKNGNHINDIPAQEILNNISNQKKLKRKK